MLNVLPGITDDNQELFSCIQEREKEILPSLACLILPFRLRKKKIRFESDFKPDMDMIWIGFVNIRFHVFSAVHTYKTGFNLIQQYASKHISPFESQSLNRQNDY